MSDATWCDVDDHTCLIGSSRRIGELREDVELAAQADLTVLITGERGVGKAYLSRVIHERSRRRHAPYVTLNCEAEPPAVIESKLFGAERRQASSGAPDQAGLVQTASAGTLFLSAIGTLGRGTQVRLLNFLNNGADGPHGDAVRPLSTRIVAAAEPGLRNSIAAGTFSEELYFRLNTIYLTVPPLRERKEDIPDLAEALLHASARELARSPLRLDRSAITCLTDYDWPGNLYELSMVVNALVGTFPEGAVIRAEDLPREICEPPRPRVASQGRTPGRASPSPAADGPSVTDVSNLAGQSPSDRGAWQPGFLPVFDDEAAFLEFPTEQGMATRLRQVRARHLVNRARRALARHVTPLVTSTARRVASARGAIHRRLVDRSRSAMDHGVRSLGSMSERLQGSWKAAGHRSARELRQAMRRLDRGLQPTAEKCRTMHRHLRQLDWASLPAERKAGLLPFACGAVVGAVMVSLLTSSWQADGGPLRPANTSGPETVVERTVDGQVALSTTFTDRPGDARMIAAADPLEPAEESAADLTFAARGVPALAPAPRRTRSSLPPVRFRGSLAVDSRPKGAEVFVNGRPAGKTPLVLRNVPAGSQVVRVELDRHHRWSSAVRVVANEQSRVTATLTAIPTRSLSR